MVIIFIYDKGKKVFISLINLLNNYILHQSIITTKKKCKK